MWRVKERPLEHGWNYANCPRKLVPVTVVAVAIYVLQPRLNRRNAIERELSRVPLELHWRSYVRSLSVAVHQRQLS